MTTIWDSLLWVLRKANAPRACPSWADLAQRPAVVIREALPDGSIVERYVLVEDLAAEPDDELEARRIKRDTIRATVDTLAPSLEGENLATLHAWAADNERAIDGHQTA